jgi:hypothetical protein
MAGEHDALAPHDLQELPVRIDVDHRRLIGARAIEMEFGGESAKAMATATISERLDMIRPTPAKGPYRPSSAFFWSRQESSCELFISQ